MEHTNLVWSVYIILAILRRIISGFGTSLLLVQYNIDRDQKKPVSTIFIRGNEITQKMCACSLLHLEIYDISSNSRSEGQNTFSEPMPYCEEQPHFENRLTSTIKYRILSWFAFAVSEFAFAVSDLLFAVTVNRIPRTYMY